MSKDSIFNNLTIIQDTREKRPIEFKNWKVEVSKLDTGDYSLKGYEDILCVERKMSTSEWSKNAIEERFEDEMKRLQHFKYKFIVCEFDFNDLVNFPTNSGIPKRMWYNVRIRPEFLIKRAFDIQVNYGIQIVYAGFYAEAAILSIFKRVVQAEHAAKK